MAKKIRKITKDYLEKAAFYYLGRYASGEGNLRMILERKVKRANFNGSDIPSGIDCWINEVVEKCVTLGLASDIEYSKMKVRSLLAQGKSLRKIQIILRQKRVKDNVIKDVLSQYEENDEKIDRASAIKYAKKRRFGPFRNPLRGDLEESEEYLRRKREKEIASMVRAGFSYNVSIEIIEGN